MRAPSAVAGKGGCSVGDTLLSPLFPSHLVMEYLSGVQSELKTHLVQEHLEEQVGRWASAGPEVRDGLDCE